MEKIIHYCWFGPKPLGKLENKCLKSWKKYFPDYKIMKWSEENVNLEECEFIKEAYANKKWAYVADYARTKALYEYGGIYFDTDMEVIKNMDEFIDKLIAFRDEKRMLENQLKEAKNECENIKNIAIFFCLNNANDSKPRASTNDLFSICPFTGHAGNVNE